MANDEQHDLATLTMQPSQADAGEGRAAGEPTRAPPELHGSPISVRERITFRGLHSSGGIGEVWRAYDEILGREVALKRLRQDKADSTANRARFYREARLTGQLDHPGIVPVYDYSSSEDGRHCFYTMRFLRGRTLLEVIAEFHAKRREQGLPLVTSEFLDLLGYYTSICNTVAFAHSRGIIHRDLKGDNVIVGDYGEVVVIDWGLAKQLDLAEPGDSADSREPAPPCEAPASAVDPVQTMQGELLGSPAYMAPEQALGWVDRVDGRTDVYGLAAILYEILTGEPPFRGPKLDALLEAIISTPPVPPSEKVPDVPLQLERVCLRGLAKRQHERPSSATELATEVRRWLMDLAARRRTEQERERFFDLSLDLLAIVDREGRLGQSNAAWAELLGWSAEARAELGFVELTVPEQREAASAALERIWSGAASTTVELRMRHVDGGTRWVDWNLRSIPHEQAVYLVGRDVTERRRNEREFEGLLESAPDATCVIDESGTIVRVNTQLERMFGYAREELLGQRVELLVPTELRGRHADHVTRYVAAPRVRPMGAALSLRGQRRDGTVFAVEISLSPVETDDRLLIACSLRDASGRDQLERRIKAVLDAAPDAMIVVDRQTRMAIVNRRSEELFGYSREELVGQPLEILIPERFHERHREHMRRYMATPTARPMAAGQNLCARHRDGSEFAVEISLSPVDTDDGLVICSAIRRARD